MEKALREAKRNTNWVEPNHDWERAVKRLLPRRCTPTRRSWPSFEPFVARVAAVGERAALGQLVLKLTAPGVPDIYQGDELAFRALVDPDNRRPVDFDWRQAMLRRLMGGVAARRRDPEAVPDPAAAGAAGAAARAVRGDVRAARCGTSGVRVRPRRRRDGRRRGARRDRRRRRSMTRRADAGATC